MARNDPSTLGSNGDGRNGDGKFAPGNKLGRGNPLAGRAARIRAVLLEKLTPEDAGEIADRLIEMAKKGDLAAVKELFDRTIGKPTDTDTRERLDALEQQITERLQGLRG